MEFNNNISIFLQIAESIRDDILAEQYPPNSKLPSVREMAAQLGVNPNTVMRAYAHLQSFGFISNRRGIGFFVPGDAIEQIKEGMRKDFIENDLPKILTKMKVLGIDSKTLIDSFKANL